MVASSHLVAAAMALGALMMPAQCAEECVCPEASVAQCLADLCANATVDHDCTHADPAIDDLAPEDSPNACALRWYSVGEDATCNDQCESVGMVCKKAYRLEPEIEGCPADQTHLLDSCDSSPGYNALCFCAPGDAEVEACSESCDECSEDNSTVDELESTTPPTVDELESTAPPNVDELESMPEGEIPESAAVAAVSRNEVVKRLASFSSTSGSIMAFVGTAVAAIGLFAGVRAYVGSRRMHRYVEAGTLVAEIETERPSEAGTLLEPLSHGEHTDDV